MDIVSENKMFDGVQGVYKHKSRALKCSMNFAVFMPNAPRNTQIPVLWFLSGLTCTHENAMLKAGMQKFAQLHKIAVVFPVIFSSYIHCMVLYQLIQCNASILID